MSKILSFWFPEIGISTSFQLACPRLENLKQKQGKGIIMTKLFDKETGHLVGEITDDQFQFLMENLEEESSEDDDYYFNEVTIDMLKEKGADEKLIGILEKAISNNGEAELRWERA